MTDVQPRPPLRLSSTLKWALYEYTRIAERVHGRRKSVAYFGSPHFAILVGSDRPHARLDPNPDTKGLIRGYIRRARGVCQKVADSFQCRASLPRSPYSDVGTESVWTAWLCDELLSHFEVAYKHMDYSPFSPEEDEFEQSLCPIPVRLVKPHRMARRAKEWAAARLGRELANPPESNGGHRPGLVDHSARVLALRAFCARTDGIFGNPRPRPASSSRRARSSQGTATPPPPLPCTRCAPGPYKPTGHPGPHRRHSRPASSSGAAPTPHPETPSQHPRDRSTRSGRRRARSTQRNRSRTTRSTSGEEGATAPGHRQNPGRQPAGGAAPPPCPGAGPCRAGHAAWPQRPPPCWSMPQVSAWVWQVCWPRGASLQASSPDFASCKSCAARACRPR